MLLRDKITKTSGNDYTHQYELEKARWSTFSKSRTVCQGDDAPTKKNSKGTREKDSIHNVLVVVLVRVCVRERERYILSLRSLYPGTIPDIFE